MRRRALELFRRLTWGELIVFALVAFHAGCFVYIAFGRLTYPLDLEWMEGGQLLQAREIMLGRSPYRPPTIDHIAYPYQPLYTVLVALVAKVVGFSAGAGRGVSIAATFALSALIGLGAFRETNRSWRWAIVAIGLVFSLYRATGYWFDLVRVDSTFLALLVAFIFATASSRRNVIAIVVLGFLAFKTKQLSIFFLWIPIVAILQDPLSERRARIRAASLYAGLLAGALFLDHVIEELATSGWYSFFTFKVPNVHSYVMERIRRELWEETFGAVPLLMFVGSWALLRTFRRQRLTSPISPWTLAALMGVVATLVTWPRIGGVSNNFLPMYLFFIPPCVVALQRWSLHLRLTRFAAVPLFLVIAHFVQQVGDPKSQVPTKNERAAARDLIRYLEKTPGPILLPAHPSYLALAGKEPSYHSVELWETTMARPALRDMIAMDIRNHKYRLIIAEEGWGPPDLVTYYKRTDDLHFGVRTYVGTVVEPVQAWVPR